jgi:glycosyltransferase involved in cell wall biosynthesis
MHFWIIMVGEPLPFLDGGKLMRYGELTRVLVDRGHRVTWWASDFSHQRKAYIGTANERVHADGIDFVLVHSSAYRRNVGIRRLLSVSAHAKNLERAISREAPPDMIVAAMPTIEACEVAVEYGKKNRVPVVVDIRDEWPEDFVRWLPAPLRALGRLVLRGKFKQLGRGCRQATALYAVSERQLEYGLRFSGRERRPADAVIYNGARPDVAKAETVVGFTDLWRGRGVGPGKFVCVYSGTLSQSRPLEPIIDAVVKLSASIPITLVIAGKGDAEGAYRRRANGHPAVLFAGWVKPEPLAALLQIADVLLAPYNPAYGFSLPTKIFDYMAAGRPILSSCPGETAALIEQNEFGLNFKFDSSAEVESGLRDLYENRDKRLRMGVEARRIFEERFNTSATIDEFARKLEGLRAAHSSCD